MEIIGIMSGTSLDGCDIAHVKFKTENSQDTFELLNAHTYNYNNRLKHKLKTAPLLSSMDLLILDKELGFFFGESVNDFIKVKNIDKKQIRAVSSHGHTVFHQPNLKITHQIGCGISISNKTKINTINDFRSKDVLAGGQGAPLVPIGDFGLFYNYAKAFLNIGGFANISFKKEKISAFDICPGNLPLNKIVSKINLAYDNKGDIAKKGKLDSDLLVKLNSLEFYKKNGPKSLGTEWLESFFMPLIEANKDIPSVLSTVCEHISTKISEAINENEIEKILITGGGAKNEHLIKLIKEKVNCDVIIPNEDLIDFKEAIIFAYMGYLFIHNRTNCLASVTGAKKDLIGGTEHKWN